MHLSESDLITGTQPNNFIKNYLAISSQIHIEGRIDEMQSSPIRRTFCLIVLFDLAVCLLFWILCVQKVTPKVNFKQEVVHYSFNSSLFDTVVLAALRFSFLEVLYGGIKSISPIWIALSTGVSSSFALIKMFMNYFPPNSNANLNVLVYITIMATFILCWVETIFLVCRVLPKEHGARKIFEYQKALNENYTTNSQLMTPNYTMSENSDKVSLTSSLDDNFFSARPTRPASPTVAESPTRLASSNLRRIREIEQKAKELEESALNVIRNSIGWTHAGGDALRGYVTYKEMSPYKGRIFKVETLFNIDAEVLHNDMVNNCEHSPVWNRQVRHVKIIESINHNTDIIYNLSNEALRGYISPRDFVLLRTWSIIDHGYLLSMTSIEHDECPQQANIIRGEYGLGAIFLQRSILDVGQCKCVWLMNNDIKGNLFRSIVDRAVPGILLEIIDGLREHCETLRVTH